MIKTKNNVLVPSKSISLRTKIKKRNVVTSISFSQKSFCTNHKMMKTENKNDDKNLTLSPIPTLHSENNRFSLCPDSYFAQNIYTVYYNRHKLNVPSPVIELLIQPMKRLDT